MRFKVLSMCCLLLFAQPSFANSPSSPSGGGCEGKKVSSATQEDLDYFGDTDNRLAPEVGDTFYACIPTWDCVMLNNVPPDDISWEWVEGVHPWTGRPVTFAKCSICDGVNSFFCKCNAGGGDSESFSSEGNSPSSLPQRALDELVDELLAQ
ncbi:MAG: hypothetical protein KDD66_03245 [Bdellovibrionales bacterium]|nr:hypothetical protein [Bdellovibrionales bacterium]